jgi:hypothetical protein
LRLPVDTSSATGVRIRARVTRSNSSTTFGSIGVHVKGAELWTYCTNGGDWVAFGKSTVTFNNKFASAGTQPTDVAVSLCSDGRYEFVADSIQHRGTIPLVDGGSPAAPAAYLHTNGAGGALLTDDLIVEQVP